MAGPLAHELLRVRKRLRISCVWGPARSCADEAVRQEAASQVRRWCRSLPGTFFTCAAFASTSQIAVAQDVQTGFQ